jgi:1-pyrroline-5-carboxylate dehydrogenase
MEKPVERPRNEKIITYAPGTPERDLLVHELDSLKRDTLEIPLIIGGKKIKSDDVVEVLCPHNHALILARVHLANQEQLSETIDLALHTHDSWASLDWLRRIAIFRKAADLLSRKERIRHVAATMLNLSKNPYEAEIDVVEFIDFLRFNSYFASQIFTENPVQMDLEMNRLDWRPLEGFVFAVSPFNFYALGGNLSTTSTMLGNVVLWKPATTTTFVNYEIMKLLMKAGLPHGVLNFVPFRSAHAEVVLGHPDFSGLHFTGSYDTLMKLWAQIEKHITTYKNIPRIIGETGGKGFIFVHHSADASQVAYNIIRGGFESQGQKCSAASRVYIPKSMWNSILSILKNEIPKITIGPVETLRHYMGAVIDKEAFQKIQSYLQFAKTNPEYEIIIGGTTDDSQGWFVSPTVIKSNLPKNKLMSEEIFGPVVTVFVYDDDKYEETLQLCDATSPYGLTGSIFAKDRLAILSAEKLLRYSAGNFYINDKPTGSSVGRQPFGGSRHSGTNDKTGLWLSLLPWVTPRSIKETMVPADEWKRDFMV